jgi:hypothetical protein
MNGFQSIMCRPSTRARLARVVDQPPHRTSCPPHAANSTAHCVRLRWLPVSGSPDATHAAGTRTRFDAATKPAVAQSPATYARACCSALFAPAARQHKLAGCLVCLSFQLSAGGCLVDRGGRSFAAVGTSPS